MRVRPRSRFVRWLVVLLALEPGCRRNTTASDLALLTARTMGMVYLEREELPEAEAEFRKLIGLAPREPLGYSALGTVYLRAGRLPEAERQIRRALALDSADPNTALLLASIYQRTGRSDSARVRLEQLVGGEHPDPRALYALAQLAREAPDSAGRRYLEYLERLVALLPANLALRLELAETQLRRRQLDSTLRQLEELRQLPPAPPAEAAPLLEQAIRALRGAREREAGQALAGFRGLLELTPAYQASRQAIQGPGQPLVGVATLGFSPRQAMLQRLGQDPRAIRDAIRFEDVTAASGLARLPAGAAGANGTAVALGDYDGDGTDDLFLAGRSGLLFRSQPGGFTERSAQAGVALPSGATAAAFADYDNDGYLDLYAADESGLGHLFRNTGRGTFRDVTREAGLERAQPLPRKALFVDLDHDGDLDLLLVAESGLRLFRNNLDGSFRDVTASSGLAGGAGGDAAFGDFDGDGRTDLVVANPAGRIALFSNRGQGRFEDVAAASGLASPSRGSEVVAAGDYNNDGLLDLFVAGGGESTLYRNEAAGRFVPDRRSARTLRGLDSIHVRAAVFLDYDNDGFQDLAVVGEPQAAGGRAPGILLFRNDGTGRFEDRSSIVPPGLTSGQTVVAWDQDRDGDLDLLITGGPAGPRLLRNDGGNLNLYVNVELKGLRTGSGKNNGFGIGARLELRAGELYQTRTVTERVTHFGVGRHLKADVVRIVWPNGVPQFVYLPETDQDVLEEQILKGSCPFVYAWDGGGYRFVTDVMWRSALGMPVGIMGSGSTAFAPAQASREYLRIPGSRLAAKDGRYTLQFTEELWETAYLDELKLLAVDHPDSVGVFVNERFVPPNAPSPLRLYQVVRPLPPAAAFDAEGNDQLSLLRAPDDRFVAGFSPAEYQGLTAPHELILDLGEGMKNPRTLLLLTGWIFPSDASINVALSQRSDRPVLPPALDVKDARGRWTTVIPDVGFPSGKNKTVIVDLTGRFPTSDRHVRIRTNLQIYWDRAFTAAEAPAAPVVTTTLQPVLAELHARGFSRSYRKGGRYGPHWFDYDSVSTAPRWRPIEGTLTRFGDVLPLLERSDDRYIIMGPGDETTIQFDASRVPPLPPGWTRDFLLYSDGWIKDADLNTAFGNTVEPLPFHGMTRYPYGSVEAYPRDAVHQRFLTTYNTRRITSGVKSPAAGSPGAR